MRISTLFLTPFSLLFHFVVDDKFPARAKLANGIAVQNLVHQHVVFGAIHISQHSMDVNLIFKVSAVMSCRKEN
jgi:hypothetical protein